MYQSVRRANSKNPDAGSGAPTTLSTVTVSSDRTHCQLTVGGCLAADSYRYLVTEKEYLCRQEIDGLRNFMEGDRGR